MRLAQDILHGLLDEECAACLPANQAGQWSVGVSTTPQGTTVAQQARSSAIACLDAICEEPLPGSSSTHTFVTAAACVAAAAGAAAGVLVLLVLLVLVLVLVLVLLLLLLLLLVLLLLSPLLLLLLLLLLCAAG